MILEIWIIRVCVSFRLIFSRYLFVSLNRADIKVSHIYFNASKNIEAKTFCILRVVTGDRSLQINVFSRMIQHVESCYNVDSESYHAVPHNGVRQHSLSVWTAKQIFHVILTHGESLSFVSRLNADGWGWWGVSDKDRFRFVNLLSHIWNMDDDHGRSSFCAEWATCEDVRQRILYYKLWLSIKIGKPISEWVIDESVCWPYVCHIVCPIRPVVIK